MKWRLLENGKEALRKADQKRRAEKEKQLIEQDFVEFNSKELYKLSDKTLAIWQSRYPTQSPQWIFATHEWQRRLNKTIIIAALIGVAGVILGTILGAAITYFL